MVYTGLRLSDVGVVGVFRMDKQSPAPHEFRHTFVQILVQRGVPVSDVADLLGDDEKTFVNSTRGGFPERLARPTKILKDLPDPLSKHFLWVAAGLAAASCFALTAEVLTADGLRHARTRVELAGATPVNNSIDNVEQGSYYLDSKVMVTSMT
jgi:hypothetical protein